jgi:NAD(P)H-dependent FMN reductase
MSMPTPSWRATPANRQRHYRPVPLLNEDPRRQRLPLPVEDRRAGIKATDGIPIVTPDEKYSNPGLLKNAVGRASHPRTIKSWMLRMR